MSSELVKTLQKSLEAKTLGDLVRTKIDEHVALLIDASSSMNHGFVGPTGERVVPIQQVRRVVESVQKARAETTLIAFGPFGNTAQIVQTVPGASGGTPMAEALSFARQHNIGRIVVISDGAPTTGHVQAIEAGKALGRCDIVYLGKPGDQGDMFMQELAEATGGSVFNVEDLADIKLLENKVMGLLSGATEDDDEDEE